MKCNAAKLLTGPVYTNVEIFEFRYICTWIRVDGAFALWRAVSKRCGFGEFHWFLADGRPICVKKYAVLGNIQIRVDPALELVLRLQFTAVFLKY